MSVLRGLLAACVLLVGWPPGPARAEAGIWLEGEESAASSFSRTEPPPALVPRLSDGDWLADADASGEKQRGARWKFSADRAGLHRIWVRKSWRRGGFRWRLDGSPWRKAGAVLEENVEFGDERTEVALAWYYLGSKDLSVGPHELELELDATPGQRRVAGIDAFFLTTDDLRIPAGSAPPPAYRSEMQRGSWFPVAFFEDPLDPDAATNVSRYVPAPAGRQGPVRVRRGEVVIGPDEEGIRFWGCTANARDVEPDVATQRARYLRKHGINAVRHHSLQEVLGLLDDEGRFESAALERFDWWFAELKRNGIYSFWAPLSRHHIRASEAYERFSELPAKAYWMRERGVRATGALSLLEPDLQDSEWRWLRTILEHRNPYTGLRYVDDPALAAIEIRNEDSLFWHNPLNGLSEGRPPEHARRLREAWAAWVHRRYPTDADLASAWGAHRKGSDRSSSRELEIPPAHALRGSKGGNPRQGDFLRFLGERQRSAYQRRLGRLREAGFEGIVITSAWKAGGRGASAANLWTDSVGDMIARHAYAGGSLDGNRGSHRIRPGAYRPFRPLDRPGGGQLAVGRDQLSGKAFGLTEWTTKPPSPWKFVSAPLVAFYGLGLQSWDAALHFSNSAERVRNGWPGLSSYVTDTPHYMGQFPALALAVHRGDVAPGPAIPLPVLDDFALFSLQTEAALTRRLPIRLLAQGRLAWRMAPGSSAPDRTLPPEPDLPVVSRSGQLTWDPASPQVRVDTPRTRGILGRTTGAPVDLSGLRIEVSTPGVSLLVSSLDDRPLATSRRILITALARDRQEGARFAPTGATLLETGGGLLWLEPVQARLRLPGRGPTFVEALDGYGRRTGRRVEIGADGSFRIDGTFAAFYYEVVREPPPEGAGEKPAPSGILK